jgi:hypothetical protein
VVGQASKGVFKSVFTRRADFPLGKWGVAEFFFSKLPWELAIFWKWLADQGTAVEEDLGVQAPQTPTL